MIGNKKADNPLVYIIVLNWNGWQDTVSCVQSLQRLDYSNYQILIVDNGSSDGSEKKLREKFPKTTTLQTGKNLGYAGGNNLGMEYALKNGAEYILLLNNDTTVEADVLSKLVETAKDNPQIGMVGPLVCYDEAPDLVQTAGMTVNLWGMRMDQVGNKQKLGQFSELITGLEAINGVCLLVKSEVIREVGLIDTDYFMYTEEVDWAHRIRKANFLLVVNPAAVIYHKMPLVGRRFQPRVIYYQTRGKVIFLKKHGQLFQFIFLLLSLSKMATTLMFKSKNFQEWRSLVVSILTGVTSGVSARLKYHD